MMANVYLCYKGGGLGSRQLEQGTIHGRRQSPSCQYCMTSQTWAPGTVPSKSRAAASGVSDPASARPRDTKERSRSISLNGG